MSPLALMLALPLLGFLVNGLAGSRLPRPLVGSIACVLPALAFVLTVQLFVQLAAGGAPITQTLFAWVAIPGFAVDAALHFDRISAVMCLVVTGVGTLIHLYSVGYMAHDRSLARYFSYLNLFLFFMLLLVLGKNLLVLFVGWEGVGLASYLLIGFWFEDRDKATSGIKAFVVNRVGDTGFVLAAFLIYGFAGSLDLQAINGYFATQPPAGGVMTAIGLLLLIGACGKSAQIPLHVWLADAMAGPTPVSALIHAATMVTAGVYLLARLNGLFLNAPVAMTVVAWTGAVTALLGATMAMVQFNLKKVLAYSTMSQIGLMVMACGLGAFTAGLFHLLTHAFFKACLFLAAGAVLHALQAEEDMRNMGALARKLPFTFAVFMAGALALCGMPPFAGFFSKDEILLAAWSSARGFPWLWVVGLTVSGLTAFYMFRAMFLTFLGKSNVREQCLPGIHEPPLSMSSVLAVLALGSLLMGLLGLPVTWQAFLGVTAPFYDFLAPAFPPAHGPHVPANTELLLMTIAVLAALAGIFTAWSRFGGNRNRTGAREHSSGALHLLVSRGYYFDRIYDSGVVRFMDWLSASVLARTVEAAIENVSLAGPAAGARRVATLFVRLQTGNVQAYAFYALLGLAVILCWAAIHA